MKFLECPLLCKKAKNLLLIESQISFSLVFLNDGLMQVYCTFYLLIVIRESPLCGKIVPPFSILNIPVTLHAPIPARVADLNPARNNGSTFVSLVAHILVARRLPGPGT